MALNDQLLAHHINTLKLAANAGKTVNPYLDEMKQIIRKSVAGFDSDKRTAKRLTTLINTLASQLNKPSGKWRKELEAQLKDFAKYEANYQASTIGGWIDAELTQPTVNQVWAAAQFQPVSIGATKAVELTTLLDTWGVNEVNRLVMGVKLGFSRGLSTNQIIRNVVGAGGLSDISKREAKVVAHDAIMHMANAARFETYAENDDIIIGYELVVTLDGRTSDICAAWPTGKVYKPTDNYQPMPPFHRNCLTGDTNVSTCSDVLNVFKRHYKGVIIDITTKSGRAISITPNHPVLTSTGWVDAKLINCGDKLVAISEVVSISEYNENNVESTFSDLFSSLDVSVDPIFVTERPSTAKDFHGDSTDSKVSVISFDSLSNGWAKAVFRKKVKNLNLFFRVWVKLSFVSFSSLSSFFKTSNPAFACVVGILGKCFNLLRSGVIHPALLLFGSVSKNTSNALKKCDYWRAGVRKVKLFADSIRANSAVVRSKYSRFILFADLNRFPKGDINTGINKALSDAMTANAESLSDIIKGNHIDGVEFDDVVNVSSREFNGHVYNLENKLNWYVSNGIITHNCRTTTAPALSPEFDIFDQGATRASKGADGGKVVSADKTYYGWLADQPASFQDMRLGKTKGLIFRNAGLSTEEFRKLSVDDLGRGLTIDEMANEDSKVKIYLGKR